MNRYRCYLVGENDEVTDVKEITAEFDVKAVLLARVAAKRAGCRHFELRHEDRIVRREDYGSICLADEYDPSGPITLGDELTAKTGLRR
jgi:hypothetical protein